MTRELDDDVIISDESEYNQGVASIKQIVLTHVGKISTLCLNEFTKGYWQEKPVKTGGGIAITKIYHPDTKKAYCNAVGFLFDIVYPYSDKDFKDLYKSVYDEEPDVDKNLALHRKIFKDINILFERINFFDSTEDVTYTSH